LIAHECGRLPDRMMERFACATAIAGPSKSIPSVTGGESRVPERLVPVSGGAPNEGSQEGESPAFRAGKGQEFPACEPR
jgi:hypothetical protein